MASAIGIYEYINIKESVYVNIIDEERADDIDDHKILFHITIAYTGMPSHTKELPYTEYHILSAQHSTQTQEIITKLSLMTTEKKIQDFESSLSLCDPVTDIFK